MTNAGVLKRYDTGIYFIPKKSIFKLDSQLSRDRVIEQKYLVDEGKKCEYISSVMFANQLGLITQVSMNCEVVTNKATNDFRNVKLASSFIILRKPRVKVTDQNFLQLLDLFKDIDFYLKITKGERKKKIVNYREMYGIRFHILDEYLP